MDVHIPKSWNQKLPLSVNHPGIWREFHLSELSDVCDFVALDNDNHIALRVCACRVNHRHVDEKLSALVSAGRLRTTSHPRVLRMKRGFSWHRFAFRLSYTSAGRRSN
jgi:hypothetical protein